MTHHDLETGWLILDSIGAPATTFRLRPVDSSGESGTLQGLDPEGNRVLLFPVEPEEKISEDRGSSGVQVVSLTLQHNGEQVRFVAAYCRKPHLNELFAVLAAEILELIAATKDRPDLAGRKVLARWRELLDRERQPGPSDSEVVGLFAELQCLKEVLLRDPAVLDRWTGPARERHDFVAPGVSLEVKGTVAREGLRVGIHGLDQLQDPVGGQLFLYVLRIEKVAEGGESIPSIVRLIGELGVDQHRLRYLLSASGFGPSVMHDMEASRFSVVESRMYPVNESFPRLIRTSFCNGASPPGVTSISYVIDLTGDHPVYLDEDQVSVVFDRIAFGGTSATAGSPV